MGRLLIKQRVVAFTDTYDIYDEDGNAKYYVRADFCSLSHNIRVYLRETEQEVGTVHEKLFKIFDEFSIEIDGEYLGVVKRRLAFIGSRYDVDFQGWTVKGDFISWNYDVEDEDGNLAATIHKEWFHWGDTYVLDIADDEDEIPALMLVLAIDAANCSKNN